MTGDESYHASCFVCRSCRSPISELVFAKTSQGIYCMKCHNQRVARSRRHAEKKRTANQQKSTKPSESKLLYDTPSVDDKSPLLSTPGTFDSPNVDNDGSQSDHNHNAVRRPDHSLSPFSSGHDQNATRPSSAGQSSKRPHNAPPPSFVRGSKGARERPFTADSAGDQLDRIPLSSSQQALAKLQGESPLLSGIHEAERQRASVTEASPKASASDGSHSPRAAKLRVPDTELSGLGIDVAHRNGHKLREESVSGPSTLLAVSAQTGSDADLSNVADEVSPRNVEYKRASRLSVLTGAVKEEPRLSKSFSFYDPDIVGLMESFGRFGSTEDLSLDMPSSKNLTKALPVPEDNGKDIPDVPSPRRGMDADRDTDRDELQGLEDSDTKHEKQEKQLPESTSISDKMRQSLQHARDGHVNMETNTLVVMLDELDSTREKIKTLQKKYDRIRRASLHAAQGFSSAREEYEQEVKARYDAEAEMLNLKREIHLQASKLAEMGAEKKQQEHLYKRNNEIKSSIDHMEKELANLRIERDLHAAEVAELSAARQSDGLDDGVMEQNLISRLQSVKERYRGDIHKLIRERDELLLDVEEMRQTREVFLQEAQDLNARNDELNGVLVKLQQRIDHAQAAEKLAAAKSREHQAQHNVHGSRGQAPGFVFGFNKNSKPSSSAASTSTAVDSHHGGVSEPHEGLTVAAPVPIAKAEAAPKKFKWMKGAKSSGLEPVRNGGNVNGVPGVSPPVPPKPLTTSHQVNVSQAQLSPRQKHELIHDKNNTHTSSHHYKASQDQHSNSANGVSNGEIVAKEHLFQPFNILRPVRCFACQKNMWGQSEMKCNFCHQVCHVRCLHSLPTSCNQPYTRHEEVTEPSGPSMFGRRLVEQMQSEGADRTIPLVVEKCVQAVEKDGMDYEGIYRKSGGTSQLKIITQLFEKGQPFDLEDRDRFNDVSAITSVLKNYFRELPEPLLTFDLYERFIECVESKNRDVDTKQSTMKELVSTLPKEHFHVLQYLVYHLARVCERADENRMNSRNLGVVFGRESLICATLPA